MDPQPPPNKPVIDDNIRRTVERTALRKVRGMLDALEREEQDDRRFRTRVYVVCGVLVLLLIWFVGELVLR
ncbi:MAG TPA: hypothetical protein VGR01_06710 [Burkholderiales bacterium]|jgi:hypothetical protein|nr:hypothetical protein [Burkholderiales bacterium]